MQNNKTNDTQKEAAATEQRWARHGEARFGAQSGGLAGSIGTPVDNARYERSAALHLARSLTNEPVTAEKLIADAKLLTKYLVDGE